MILQVANGMKHLYEMDFTITNSILDNILMMQIGAYFIVKLHTIVVSLNVMQ